MDKYNWQEISRSPGAWEKAVTPETADEAMEWILSTLAGVDQQLRDAKADVALGVRDKRDYIAWRADAFAFRLVLDRRRRHLASQIKQWNIERQEVNAAERLGRLRRELARMADQWEQKSASADVCAADIRYLLGGRDV